MRKPISSLAILAFLIAGTWSLQAGFGQEQTGADPAATKSQPSADQTEGPKLDEKAQKVLRDAAELYRGAKSFAVDHEYVMHVRAPGADNRMVSRYSTRVERPNRLALRMEEGEQGLNLVSDGEHVYTHLPMMGRYTESEAPATFQELFEDPFLMMLTGSTGITVLHLLADDPYEKLMEGVTESRYLGTEEVAEQSAHHLAFSQEQMDWELWIAAQDKPVILKAVLDLSKMFANSGLGEETLKSLKYTVEETYTDWRFDLKPDAAAFAFTAPEGAEKVASFFEGFGGGQEELSELLGEPAPELDLKRLDEGQARLTDHRDKEIVILDFWATWCGPCVRAMPLVSEVAGAFKDKGVALYAVNLREEPETIRPFLEEHELEVSVLLDSDGAVADAYGVTGIPTLVLIDKKGTVQKVHVGFSPDIKDTLTEDLNALLEGRNLAEEALKARDEQAADLPEPSGLELVWSARGRYSGVAAGQNQKTIFALAADGNCDVLNPAGEKQRSFPIGSDSGTLRLAQLTGGEQGDLLAFRSWGSSIRAVRSDGTELWTESGGQGIDDVWAADLDDDGRDEIIVGYNGATGLHVFDFDGKRRWEYTKIGNVWHVSAGDVTGDGNVEVVSTSARGSVHLFDAEGKELKTLSTDLYANMVRLARLGEADAATILVAGSGNRGEAMAALDAEGNPRWSLGLPGSAPHVDSLAVASKEPWAAVGLRGGSVLVVDLTQGKIIASASDQGRAPEVGWGMHEDAPLLLVATGAELNAFRVVPSQE